MAAKKPKRRKTQKPPDDDFLSQFCSEIALEDVDFSVWSESHHSCDLRVFLEVRKDELGSRCVKTLRFSRTVVRIEGGRTVREREKMTIEIAVPEACQGGEEIVLKGVGDVGEGAPGDVFVVIKLVD